MDNKTKKKNPEVRFKGFTEDWEVSTLGQIAESFDYGLNAPAIEYDGVNQYIRITDIDDKTSKFNKKSLTSPGTNLEFADNYILKEGDVLFARTGASVGKSYLYQSTDGLVYFAGFLIRARLKPNHDMNFIFQNTLTNNYNKFIKITSQRSGQPGVNAQEYSEFKLMIPSPTEQKQIGSFFQNLDNLITLHQKKYDKLIILKKAMLVKMFPKNGAVVPVIRFKGFTEDWTKKKLNEFSSYHSSSLSVSDANTKGKYKLYDANKVIGFTDKNVQNCEYITIIKDGSGVGRVRLMPKNTSFIATMGALRSTAADIYFLFCCLIKTDFTKHITGATIPHIYFSKYGEEYYFIPDDYEQQKIGEYFKNLNNQIALHQTQLDKLKNIKKACFSKMFVA